MKVKGITCAKCNQFIYSRAFHDFHYCKCGAVAIDGGFEYLRIIGDADDFTVEEKDIGDVNKKMLYNDWNYRYDEFGRVDSDNRGESHG